MIAKEVTLVVPYEGENPALMLGDLRRFMDQLASAEDDVDVAAESRLYDGRMSHVFSARYEVRR